MIASLTARCRRNDGSAGTSGGMYSLLVPSPRIAAIGSTKSPIFVFFSPPHLPRKSTAFGETADRRSIVVAAMALPMPNDRIVMSSAVADSMGLSRPTTGTPNRSANIST